MPILQTGDHILLCTRGAGGFPSQGRRLCAIYPEEEGEPSWEPSWPREGGAGREPGAHRQERGEKIWRSRHLHVKKLFSWLSIVCCSFETLPPAFLCSSTTLQSSVKTFSTSTMISSSSKMSHRRSPSRVRRTSMWPKRSIRGPCSPCRPTGCLHYCFIGPWLLSSHVTCTFGCPL